MAAKATLVVDMKGTLMAQVNAKQRPDLVEHAISVGSVLVLKRPMLDEFLERMADLFEVVAFTCCGERLASQILDALDPHGKYISSRLYAKSCKPNGIKDLTILGRPLERVVIIDDSYKKCSLNPDNWVPISAFKGNLEDRQLVELIPFLEKISSLEDVRPAIREVYAGKVAIERARLGEFPLDAGENKVKMKGHQIEGSGRINALGRALTKILRHRAVEHGLDIRSDGFCKVDDLLKLEIKTRSGVSLCSHTVDDVVQAVEHNTKNRLSTMMGEDGILYIRASQGHSLDCITSTELLREIRSADEAPVAVHGTSRDALPGILQSGLKRMGRNHIHFATGLPGDDGVTSGIRSTSQVFIYLNVGKAIQDNMKLYMSDNHVLLTEGFEGTIPCDYFDKVVQCP